MEPGGSLEALRQAEVVARDAVLADSLHPYAEGVIFARRYMLAVEARVRAEVAASPGVLIELTAALGGAVGQIEALGSTPSENAKQALAHGIEAGRAALAAEGAQRNALDPLYSPRG